MMTHISRGYGSIFTYDNTSFLLDVASMMMSSCFDGSWVNLAWDHLSWCWVGTWRWWDMTLGVRYVTFDDVSTFSWRDMSFGGTFSPLEHDSMAFGGTFSLLEHDVMAFGGFYTTNVTFWGEFLMYLCYTFMFEAILGVNHDLSNLYHWYIMSWGLFEGNSTRIASYGFMLFTSCNHWWMVYKSFHCYLTYLHSLSRWF